MNFKDANRTCSEYGSYLPRPRFADENDFFRSFFPNTWLDVTRDLNRGSSSDSTRMKKDLNEIRSTNGHLYEFSAFQPSNQQGGNTIGNGFGGGGGGGGRGRRAPITGGPISSTLLEKALKYDWMYTGETGRREAEHFKMNPVEFIYDSPVAKKTNIGGWKPADAENVYASVRD